MKTIAEQIADLENTRAAKAARMSEVMTKSLEEGRSTDSAEGEEFDTLEAELKTIDADLVRLKKLEKLNAEKAAPVDGTSTKAAGESRAGVQVKNTQKSEPGIDFARYALCVAAAKGNILQAAEIAKSRYPDNEPINLRLKAAVEAGTTLDATNAGPLVRANNFEGDFVEFLRPQTIIGKFGAGNVPSLRRIPFNVRIVGQTSGGAGYWVGEGAPKPLTAFDFSAVELRWAKVANIAVLTEELIRFSNPSAEALVRQALADALIARLDMDFIDPAKAAVANVSPASITNGVTPVTSSGSDADHVRADLKALWAGYIANNINPTSAVYIMSATTALSLSLMLNPLGQAEFPGISMNGGTLNGVPVIVSEYVAGDSDGGMVILVNANDVYLADDGQVAIDASREASLQMLDNPTNNSATGTPTTMVSMFQTNSVALRAERYINWAKRRPQAVAYLTGVNWG
jgi:HK97 family phage major capsid protein